MSKGETLWQFLRRWAEKHAYELFVGMLVLVICELMVLSAVPR